MPARVGLGWILRGMRVLIEGIEGIEGDEGIEGKMIW